MSVDSRIIKRIKRLMVVTGMTRYKLSVETGLSQTAVGRFLDGKTSDVKLSTLERIAKALDCTVEVILRKRQQS